MNTNRFFAALRRMIVAAAPVVMLAAAGSTSTGCAGDSYYCDATACYYCDGTSCRTVNPPTPTTCARSSECPAGQVCTTAGCAIQGCSSDRDCGNGLACVTGAGGTRYCARPGTTPTPVTPSCTSNAQCQANEVCSNGQCVMSTNPGCTMDSQCSGSQLCVSGRCVDRTSTCQFDNQCGAGRVCINNECRAQCDAMRACPTGQVCTAGICRDQTNGCTSDAMCAMGQRCVNGACLQTCTAGTSGSCGSAELYCDDQGLCRPDTRPRPFCTNNSECRDGSQCVAGLCRVPCSPAMADMCARVDATYRNCAPISYLPTNTNTYCITDREFRPLCNRQSDCAAGQSCVNGACQ